MYNIFYYFYHFILLRLNPFNRRVDRDGWWFDSLRPSCGCLSAEGAKTFPAPGYLHSEDGVV